MVTIIVILLLGGAGIGVYTAYFTETAAKTLEWIYSMIDVYNVPPPILEQQAFLVGIGTSLSCMALAVLIYHYHEVICKN